MADSEPTSWHENRSTAREFWRECPQSEALVAAYLGAAREQCITFLQLELTDPLTRDGAPIPTSWALAQVLQAADLYASTQTGDRADTSGMDGLQLRRPRMSGTVRNLLLPYIGGPVIA